MSQRERILKSLQKGNRITPLSALRDFNCLRAGARIEELRKQGYNIITKRITRKGKSYAQYRLEE